MSSESSVITKVERATKVDNVCQVNRPIGMTNPDTPPERVVLVACGSYNPPTNMHLRMFELARDALHRDKRYQVIAGIMSPVNDDYGKHSLVPSKHRCAMLRLALHDSDWISLDTWECDQDAWMETVKVLRYYRDNPMSHQVAENTEQVADKKRKRLHVREEHTTPIRIMLLCGADFLQSFQRPGLWEDSDIEEIVRDFGIVCISRTGSDTNIIAHESDLLSKHRSNIHLVTEWLSNEISSTGVRRSLRRSESIKYLLPNAVISYIELHKLYTPTNCPAEDVHECCQDHGPGQEFDRVDLPPSHLESTKCSPSPAGPGHAYSSSEEELVLLNKLKKGDPLDIVNITTLMQQVDLIRDQFVSGKTISDILAIDDLRITCKDNTKDNNNRQTHVDTSEIDESPIPRVLSQELALAPKTPGQTTRSTTFYPCKANDPQQTSFRTNSAAGKPWPYANSVSTKNSFDSEDYTLKPAHIKEHTSGVTSFPSPSLSQSLPSTSNSLPPPTYLTPCVQYQAALTSPPSTAHHSYCITGPSPMAPHNRRNETYHDTRVPQAGTSREYLGMYREQVRSLRNNAVVSMDKMSSSRDREVGGSRENNPQTDHGVSDQKVSNLRMCSFTPETCV